MREKLTMAFAMIILAIMIPYLGTMALTGRGGTTIVTVATIDSGKTVSLEIEGAYVVLDVEAYLRGVLPGILPGDTAPEVWKALAVAERTNIYKKMQGMGNIDSEELDSVYLSEQEIRERFGEQNYDAYMDKIEEAILATAGVVILYDGECIDAMYHRVSVGTTASAEELFGKSVPYLTAVVSNHDVESKDYMNLVTVSKAEVQELSILESTEHGYVKKVMCNGEELTGEQTQERFGLSSLNYYIEDMGEEFRIVSLGKGHGLGMSLYGASVLEKSGRTYEEILCYYYTGVQLSEKLSF